MKRMLALILAALLALCALSAAAEETREDITVKILFPQNNVLRSAMDTTKVWDYIYENTGIRFEVQTLVDGNQLATMFASRDYPDILANVGVKASQLTSAAEAGDVVKLDDYFDTLLPNWKAFFEANPKIYNIEKVNGGLYSLPWSNLSYYERGLHMQWLYNFEWLEEIGADVPTTTEEFKEVLLAIKEAAGKGTIPADVIPFYFRYGQASFMSVVRLFGLPVTETTWLYVDEEQNVVSSAVDLRMKEAVKYLADLYALNLIPAEVFTDDSGTELVKTSAVPGLTFCYSSYANRSSGISLPMAPMDCGIDGLKPYAVSRPYVQNNKYCCVVFSESPYVERILEFLNWAIEDKNAVTLNYGLEGVVWDYTENGQFKLNFWENNTDLMTQYADSVGFCNSWFNALSQNLHANFYVPEVETEGSREWAIVNIYADYLPDWDSAYVGGTLGEDDQLMLGQLDTELKTYRDSMFARWITGEGDADAEWEEYVSHMNELGHEEWLELKQKAYDLVAK